MLHKLFSINLIYGSIRILLTLIFIYCFGISWQLLASLLLGECLLRLAMVDIKQLLLPDDITLPCLWAGLIVNCFELFTTLHAAVIGAIAGYLIFWIVAKIYYYFTGNEGLGQGDFKLLAMLGAWLGWQQLPSIILLSSLLGIIIGAILVWRQRSYKIRIPFGPFLAIAGVVVLIT